MNNATPLLKSLGYKAMLETIPSEDAQLAKSLLAPFLRDFVGVDAEKVAVLAYLLGVKQGSCNSSGEDAGKGMEESDQQFNHVTMTHSGLSLTYNPKYRVDRKDDTLRITFESL